ncbi:MAG: ATP-binding protein [Aliidongia sp.]
MAEVDDRPRTLQVATGLREDGSVKLAVRDSGTGFDPQSVEKLFERFTRPNRAEWASDFRSAVRSWKITTDRLWAEANEGPGATFSFYIPVAAEPFGAPVPRVVGQFAQGR